MIRRGVAICHYNRIPPLEQIIMAVKETTPPDTKIVVCDDGSDPVNSLDIEDPKATEDIYVEDICKQQEVILIKGPNLGVAANKNRALWALQDCNYLVILEDDLKPTEKGWFETYEKAAAFSGVHHFCRVQDKEVDESVPTFSNFMRENGLTPLYGPSPRGDFTFLTRTVVEKVGAFNPKFIGAGYAHGEWSARVHKAGLIPHPNKWIDIKEGRDKLIQIGDTTGGRWEKSEKEIKKQLHANNRVRKELEQNPYIFHRLVLS